MVSNTEPLFDEDDSFDAETEDQLKELESQKNQRIDKALDARRKLEAYWEQKALNDELGDLDDEHSAKD